jgi:hypothetical protein
VAPAGVAAVRCRRGAVGARRRGGAGGRRAEEGPPESTIGVGRGRWRRAHGPPTPREGRRVCFARLPSGRGTAVLLSSSGGAMREDRRRSFRRKKAIDASGGTRA